MMRNVVRTHLTRSLVTQCGMIRPAIIAVALGTIGEIKEPVLTFRTTVSGNIWATFALVKITKV